ncbi:LPXTG cell wall anchor domain-containing protein, partial [Mediterraneibacter gnavus]|uniref:LPXTG cell wall anchor domain-containing protein n=2 Tax=Mediterraneibacter gnavus TaxID=33038 RepID=UPI001185C4A6
DSFMPGSLLFCMKSKKSVCYSVADNTPDVVVTTLKLINVPTEPKLPQTGDNANPLLYLGIGALALITGVGVGLRGRKKKNKQ